MQVPSNSCAEPKNLAAAETVLASRGVHTLEFRQLVDLGLVAVLLPKLKINGHRYIEIDYMVDGNIAPPDLK